MPSSIRPGETLAGRYRLQDLLAESGGARFWRARDTVLERYVAVHVIAADDARAAALLAAARRSAGVLDRRFLRVLDAEQERDICYVVNEWGEGISLDILVNAIGTIGPRRSAWLVAEVADSIAVAHEAGIAHGRLVPENVLVDGHGELKIIGMCVDAAMHGLAGDRVATDVADLAGLLHCCLTGRWAGASASAVPAAPRQHGEVLRPRRVRAGIPRPLDELCDQVLHAHHNSRRAIGLSSARGVSAALYEFVGDTGGMAEALRRTVPPPRALEQVVLPQVPDPMVEDDVVDEDNGDTQAPADPELRSGDGSRDGSRDARSAHSSTADAHSSTTDAHSSTTDAHSSTTDGHSSTTTPGAPAGGAEQPTEAGMPIFDDDGDVDWQRLRSTPPPPPPPFEDPPEKPLFAPDAPERKPVTSRISDDPTDARAGRWPWVTATNGPVGPRAGHATAPHWDTGPRTGELPVVTDDTVVPGRSWLRLGFGLAAAVLLLVAVVIAFNMGRGLTPLGDDPAAEPSPRAGEDAVSGPVTGLQATDLDPQGDPSSENPEETEFAVDGDPTTAWRTENYIQQLGPNGLKTGVGLVVDLGAAREVTNVDLTLVGAPTGVSLYLTPTESEFVPDREPDATDTAASERLSLDLDPSQTGRYLVIWLTGLPEVEGGYRGQVAEIAVEAVETG